MYKQTLNKRKQVKKIKQVQPGLILNNQKNTICKLTGNKKQHRYPKPTSNTFLIISSQYRYVQPRKGGTENHEYITHKYINQKFT